MVFSKVNYFTLALALVVAPAVFAKREFINVVFKGGYAIPTNSSTKKAVYQLTDSVTRQNVADLLNNGHPIFGPELNVRLLGNVYAFGQVDYLQKKATAADLLSVDTLKYVPVIAGLKYMLPVTKYFNVYVGAGVQTSYYQITNADIKTTLSSKVSGWSFGGVGEAGFRFNIGKHFNIGGFVAANVMKTKEVNFLNLTVKHSHFNLGSVIPGIFVGVRF